MPTLVLCLHRCPRASPHPSQVFSPRARMDTGSPRSWTPASSGISLHRIQGKLNPARLGWSFRGLGQLLQDLIIYLAPSKQVMHMFSQWIHASIWWFTMYWAPALCSAHAGFLQRSPKLAPAPWREQWGSGEPSTGPLSSDTLGLSSGSLSLLCCG